MTWEAIARENLLAAKSLASDAWWRSAVSRAYYAAYSLLSGKLDGLAQFPAGRFGPLHEQLPQLVMTHITQLELFERRKLSRAARCLYRYRIAADYELLTSVDEEMTRFALQDASTIARSVLDAEH